jgi:ribosomal protein S18 acetylase RimI-like enzyme
MKEKAVISGKMQIVPLESGAIHAVVALWKEAGLLRPWNNPWEDARKAIACPSSAILGGVRAGELVATAMVGNDGHRGWVYYLAVSKEVRRRGIGRLMMTACETWLREREASKIHLMVRLDNKEVADFYGRLGYLNEEFLFFSKRLT